MKRNKFNIIIISLLLFCFSGFLCPVKYVKASTIENVYSVYDEYGALLLQKQDVFVGDMFLTKDFKKYEVVFVDEVNKLARAKFLEFVKKPEVDLSYSPSKISEQNPIICLYMTHNDESYVTGDGVDSVYGKGGIHDVAKSIKSHLELKGVKTYLSENLHIPHDSLAYSRSNVTAKELINTYSPDAIFDIHRDGASRSTYVKKVNGVDRCKVRIVVGKASKNFEIAEKFALYLMAVSEKVCDWLFLDIYYASGHYNQGLHNKALLFEMGSHMVEKNLVLKSTQPLVDVLTTALFNTTVNNETGQLTVNGDVTPESPLINNAMDEFASEKNKQNAVPYIVVFIILGSVIISVLTIVSLNKRKKR